MRKPAHSHSQERSPRILRKMLRGKCARTKGSLYRLAVDDERESMARETVLIVEDDNALRGLYRFALSMAGFSLGHGKRALERAGEDGKR